VIAVGIVLLITPPILTIMHFLAANSRLTDALAKWTIVYVVSFVV